MSRTSSIIGTVILLGAIVHDRTGDSVAALTAGLTLLVLPTVYTYPMHGFRPKYAVLLFGLLSLYCMLQDRPALAGASAATAAGFWQFGAVFVVLVLGMAVYRQRHSTGTADRPVRHVVAAVAVVTVLTVLPFVVWGAFVPLVVEAVIAPFYSQNSPLLAHVYAVVRELGYAIVLLPIGVYGWIRLGWTTTSPPGSQWWLVAGGILYGVQVLFFDMDDWPDFMVMLLFIALGVGVVVAAQPPSSPRRWATVGLVILLVLIAPVWVGSSSAPLKDEFEAVQRQFPPERGDRPDVTRDTDLPAIQTTYWEQRTPETCYYRRAPAEVLWVAQTPAEFDDARCGQWPFGG